MLEYHMKYYHSSDPETALREHKERLNAVLQHLRQQVLNSNGEPLPVGLADAALPADSPGAQLHVQAAQVKPGKRVWLLLL